MSVRYPVPLRVQRPAPAPQTQRIVFIPLSSEPEPVPFNLVTMPPMAPARWVPL